MPDDRDVLLAKAAVIERCIRRVRDEHRANPELDDFTHQDALILNVERACQACIDIGMQLCASRKLGIPQQSAEVFRLLHENAILDQQLCEAMIRMVGFKNRAVHMNQSLDLEIVRSIATTRVNDFVTFLKAIGITIKP